MASTPLTDAAREVAIRAGDWENLHGNVNYIRQLVYQDSVTLWDLHETCRTHTPETVPSDVLSGLTDAHAAASNAMELMGNMHMVVASWQFPDKIIAGADWLDSVTP